MPKIFEYKQAKEQINYFKKLITDLKKGSYFGVECLKNLKEQIALLYSSGYFFVSLEKGLTGKEIDLEDVEAKTLITNIYYYIEGSKFAGRCNFLYNQNSALVEELISSLSSGSNALFWLFSSKRKKLNAEESYEKGLLSQAQTM